MRFFAALSCLAVSAMSQALLLDNFTVPYSKTIHSGSWVDFQTDPTLYTGERDVELAHLRGPTGEVSAAIGSGNLVFRSAQGVGGAVFLQYDGIGDEALNTGQNRHLINRPNSGNTFPEGTRIVRFHVLSVTSAESSLDVYLFKNGVHEFTNGRNPVVGGPQIVDVPFHPLAFAQSDSLALVVNGRGTEIVLSHVELVPEPDAMLALATLASPILVRGLRGKRKSNG